MTPILREQVRDRAKGRCEYCHIPAYPVPQIVFHIEHIVALQHGGRSVLENLAFACDRCNFFKGPNLSSIDPETGTMVRLFNPRTDTWHQYFQQINYRVVGLNSIGRATVELLQMNTEARQLLRIQFKIDLTID